MTPPRDDEALAAMAKEITRIYVVTNGFDPERGKFNAMLADVVAHAIAYAFKVGYRARVGEEAAQHEELA